MTDTGSGEDWVKVFQESGEDWVEAFQDIGSLRMLKPYFYGHSFVMDRTG